MSRLEIRASLSLSSLFALRMLGLFLILPVFAVHAQHLEHGDNRTLVGIGLGIYGLTQGLLQIPFGMASDRYGRKRVIIIGLLLFALGSFVAAFATDIWTAILGRAIQGAGAISAAVTAFTADLTREEHRTKAMAMIGGSIGLMFALSLTVAPALYESIGMAGIFILTGVLSLGGIWVTVSLVPAESLAHVDSSRRVAAATLGDVLRNFELFRLNVGIFVLHMAQMAMFVVIPVALVRHGNLPIGDHWKVYLPVVLVSFVLMVPPLLWAERRGHTKAVFLGSIALMLVVQIGFLLWLSHLAAVVILLLGFFVAFNLLEASLPSLVSRIAPANARGTALGVYNTTQALGLFVGGAVGGWLAEHHGESSVFVFGLALFALWFGVAFGMNAQVGARRARPTGKATST
jgi:MFS family permease